MKLISRTFEVVIEDVDIEDVDVHIKDVDFY